MSLRENPTEFLPPVKDQADCVAAAGAQANPGRIGNIAQSARGQGDLFERFSLEIGSASQRERNCREAQAGGFGDCPEGRTP